MRTRPVLALAFAVLLSATAAAGLLDTFRGTVAARRAAEGLPRARRAALARAENALSRGGLLADDVRNARSAVAHVESAFRRDAEFDAAESALAGGLAAAVADDADRVGRLFLAPAARRPSDRDLADRAGRRAAAAAAATSPLRALRLLDLACGDLRRAFPPMPAFAAPDANAASPTHGAALAVRGQADRVSAWYFVRTT